MNDEFDKFLKDNMPRGPGAPLGEKQRIWRAIEGGVANAPRFKWWTALVPAAFALAVIMAVNHSAKSPRDAEIEKILTAAITYELIEDEPGFP